MKSNIPFKKLIKKSYISVFGIGKYLKLYTYLFYKKPITLRLDIAATCNAQCPFCPRVYMEEGRLKGSMDFERIKEILIEAKSFGIKVLKVYITSEPTVHKEFNKIMKFSKDLGFENHVSTNASLIPRAIEGLKLVDKLQISVEGWDKESYEKFRYPLKFDKVYENLKLLNEKVSKEKQQRYIHLPVTRNTDLKKFLKLWGEFVDTIKIDFMQPANIYNKGLLKAEFNESIKDDYYDFKKQGKNYACFDPFAEIVVAYDGKILLCCLDFNAKLPLGNISDGFEKVWKNKNRRNIQKQFFTQKLSTCNDCSLFFNPSLEVINKLNREIANINKLNISKAKLISKFN
jgi:radical SAM protein with 4Fe4S-binding SPASM domain